MQRARRESHRVANSPAGDPRTAVVRSCPDGQGSTSSATERDPFAGLRRLLFWKPQCQDKADVKGAPAVFSMDPKVLCRILSIASKAGAKGPLAAVCQPFRDAYLEASSLELVDAVVPASVFTELPAFKSLTSLHLPTSGGSFAPLSLLPLTQIKTLKHLHIDAPIGGGEAEEDLTRVLAALLQCKGLASLKLSRLYGAYSLPLSLAHASALQSLRLTRFGTDRHRPHDEFKGGEGPNEVGAGEDDAEDKWKDHPGRLGARELPASLGDLHGLMELATYSKTATSMPESLFRLCKLKVLSLRLPELSELPAQVGDLVKLETLALLAGKLPALPDTLVRLTKLVTLHLECAILHALPENLGQLLCLNSLRVSSQRMRTVPESLVRLENLAELSLLCGDLVGLPGSMAGMARLKRLQVHSTKMEEFPGAVLDLDALEHLDLKGDRREIPEGISALTKLQVLKAFGYSLPQSVWHMPSLKTIISDTDLLHFVTDTRAEEDHVRRAIRRGENLAPVDSLDNARLRYLHVHGPGSYLQLHHMHSAQKFQHLEKLTVESCDDLQFVFAPRWKESREESLEALGTLKELSIINCPQMDYIPLARNLQTLRLMACGNCHGAGIPDEISQLTCLTSLELNKVDNLCKIPRGLGNLNRLERLSLKDLAIKSLPSNLGKLSLLTALQLINLPELEALPPSVGKLKMLKSLRLEGCENLKTLPHSMQGLTALTSLELCCSKRLQRLPESLWSLPSLEKLLLSQLTSLSDLPQDMSRLCALRALSFLACTKVQKLPDGLEKLLVSIKLVDLASLSSLPRCFSRLTQLQELVVENCKCLSLLPDCLPCLPNLPGNLAQPGNLRKD